MRRQAVPDQQDRALLSRVQFAQERNERFVVLCARPQFKEQVRIPAIWFECQRARQRKKGHSTSR